MDAAGHDHIPWWSKPLFLSAEAVARVGLSSLFGGRANVISGWVNKFMMWTLRFTPRWLMVRVGNLTMGRQ